jgi:hypothetical protein
MKWRPSPIFFNGRFKSLFITELFKMSSTTFIIVDAGQPGANIGASHATTQKNNYYKKWPMPSFLLFKTKMHIK